MKAKKTFLLLLFCCALQTAHAAHAAHTSEELFVFDTNKLLKQAVQLKPLFKQELLSQNGSHSLFLKNLLKLSIYYNDVVGMYELDKCPVDRQIVESINEIFSSIQYCSHEHRTLSSDLQNSQQAALAGLMAENMDANQAIINSFKSKKRWKYIKYGAIGVASIVGITLLSLGTYYCYKQIQSWFQDPLKPLDTITMQEIDQMEKMEEKADEMLEEVEDLEHNIAKVSNQNQEILEATQSGIQIAEAAGAALRQAREMYEDVLPTKRELVEAREELLLAQDEIEDLKQMVKGFNALRTIDVSHDHLLVQEYNKQKGEIEKLEGIIEGLGKQVNRNFHIGLDIGEVALKTKAKQKKIERVVAENYNHVTDLTKSLRLAKDNIAALRQSFIDSPLSPKTPLTPPTPDSPKKKRPKPISRRKKSSNKS